jgi:hypothetical protein
MKAVVYRIGGMEAVTVRQAVAFGEALTMDVYYPPGATAGQRHPAVLFVTGFPDPGFESRMGCKQKEMASYVSWARLFAASGIVAITYANEDPAADAIAALRYVRKNAGSLNVDERAIGIWSCSGNVPTALSLLMQEQLACAVLCYGLMLDLDGETAIADAQKQWHFANPAAGKTVDDIPRNLPILIARARNDSTPRLNEMIDRFTTHALSANLPVTVVTQASGPHSFDVMDDSEESRQAIREIVSFTKIHLANRT